MFNGWKGYHVFGWWIAVVIVIEAFLMPLWVRMWPAINYQLFAFCGGALVIVGGYLLLRAKLLQRYLREAFYQDKREVYLDPKAKPTIEKLFAIGWWLVAMGMQILAIAFTHYQLT
jgi:hypothetical protein